MNELVGSTATKEQIKQWAYMNRISVDVLDYEDEFESLKEYVDQFVKSDLYSDDEHKNWDLFLNVEI
jgi:hypothetical protein